MKNSSTAAKKRLSTNDDDDNEHKKKLKRTRSDTSLPNNEENFSLNQFYLDRFLLILSSLLQHHKCLFNENEIILFDKFQNLSG